MIFFFFVCISMSWCVLPFLQPVTERFALDDKKNSELKTHNSNKPTSHHTTQPVRSVLAEHLPESVPRNSYAAP